MARSTGGVGYFGLFSRPSYAVISALTETPEALDLFDPIYVPMIVEPRPWTSLSEGGYLVTPMTLFKRQTGKRAQKRLQKADLSAVYAAVNALQNTPFRMNQAIYRFQ